MIIKAHRSLMPINQRTERVSKTIFSKVYPAPQAAAARISMNLASQGDGFHTGDSTIRTHKV
ncbi:hypothetical protein BCOR_0046 [Bifidobacterium coryneforme]|nr:hypothetical protein BCOR_0046 [Bifidobacterium coryneforme]